MLYLLLLILYVHIFIYSIYHLYYTLNTRVCVYIVEESKDECRNSDDMKGYAFFVMVFPEKRFIQ